MPMAMPQPMPPVPEETEKIDPSSISNAVWKGTYTQDGNSQDMTFKYFSATLNGKILGQGIDNVGSFDISGSVNAFGDA